MRGATPILLCLVTTQVACKVYDELFCDSEHLCRDPLRPYCDLQGEYPASEGIGRTCIPDPSGKDAGGSEIDGSVYGLDDGGMADATAGRRVVQLAVGVNHTCALLSDGGLRCWGSGSALGYPSTNDIGDDEHPFEAGDVPTGGVIKQVAAGYGFTCALYDYGAVRCWGRNLHGELGYGDVESRSGPGYTPDRLPDIDLGGMATSIVAGFDFSCALLEDRSIRCWGRNDEYQLATGDVESIGDDEVPGSRMRLQVGGPAAQIAVGGSHACAVLEGGTLRCWGTTTDGPLGYVSTEPVGDNETPEEAGDIEVGAEVVSAVGALDHTCALIVDGRVRCWGNGDKKVGSNQIGVLGYQETEDIGDDETPASRGDLSIGGRGEELMNSRERSAALVLD